MGDNGIIITVALFFFGLVVVFIWWMIASVRAHSSSLLEQEGSEEKATPLKRHEKEPDPRIKITTGAVLTWYLTEGKMLNAISPLKDLYAAKWQMRRSMQEVPLFLASPRPPLQLAPPKHKRPSPPLEETREEEKEEEPWEDEEEEEPEQDFYTSQTVALMSPPKSLTRAEVISLIQLATPENVQTFRAAFIEVLKPVYAHARAHPNITQSEYVGAAKILTRRLWNELLSAQGLLRALQWVKSEQGETRLIGESCGTLYGWIEPNYDRIVQFAQEYQNK